MKKRFDSEITAGIAGYLASVYVIILVSNLLSQNGINFSESIITLSILSFIATIFSANFWFKPALFGPIISTAVYFSLLLKHFNRATISLAVILTGIYLLIIAYSGFYYKIMRDMKKNIQQYMIVSLGAFLLSVALKYISLKFLIYFTILLILSRFTNAAPLLVLLGAAIFDPQPNLKADFVLPHLQLNNLNFGIAFSLSLLFFTIIVIDLFSVSLSIINRLGKKISNKPLIIAGSSSILSGIFGFPPISLMAESHISISSGARFGKSSVITAILYLFTPIILPLVSKIPNSAIYAILAYIGILMIKNIPEKINELIAAPIIAFVSQSLPIGITVLFVLDAIKNRKRKIALSTIFFLIILTLHYLILFFKFGSVL